MERMEHQVEPEEETPMEVANDGPEEVVLSDDSDLDSSEYDDEDEVIPVPIMSETRWTKPRPTNTNNVRPTMAHPAHHNAQPDVIDLTKEDDDVMITEDGNVESTRYAPGTSTSAKAKADDDLPEVIEVNPVSNKESAEEQRTKGNDYFKIGLYSQALDMYSRAITLMPSEATYYGNRSACYMMLKKYKETLADVKKALQLDPEYEKGYLRLIRTTLLLGNIKECEMAFEAAVKNNVSVGANDELMRLNWLKNQMTEIETTKAKKDYRKLVFLTSQALEVASADNNMKMMKADSLVRLGRHAEAQDLCTEVLLNDGRCPEALYIRALCHYLDDNVDKSILFVRQGLQYAPDNNSFQTLFKKLKMVKELRESGGLKFSSQLYGEAKKDYFQCLSIVSEGDMMNITIQSKLHFNIALIAHKSKQLEESLEACSKAIELNSKYLKAIIHRAKIYEQKEMFDDAVHDLEAALRIDPTLKTIKKDLHDVKIAAKRAKRKDYYKILNVDKNATDDEIRKAYKKRALLHHPDRHASAPEVVQKEQERLFKDLGEAYEVLSDSKKRFRYDQGADLMDGGGYEPSYDSQSDFINIFFGGGGIPSFRPGQPGGSRGTQFHHTFRH